MKTTKKNALAFWYNLKGNYDIIVFDNKRNLNKFAKEYKEIFAEFEQGKLTIDEFDFFTQTLQLYFEEYIVDIVNEIYSKDFECDKFGDKYITICNNNKKQKITICEFLEWGV